MFQLPVSKIKSIVNKNPSRFPNDFLFRITNQENKTETLAFTMAGLFMLSGQIKTELAQKISVQLIETIVSHKPHFVFDLITDLSNTKE